jgi:hypothetical protein
MSVSDVKVTAGCVELYNLRMQATAGGLTIANTGSSSAPAAPDAKR